MKIIIPTLLGTLMVFADNIGTRTEFTSSQLDSKIYKGVPAENEEYKYTASLQLGNFHICSSGLIKKGFLITTRECTVYIANRIIKHRATAVFGNVNLRMGQRISVLSFAYFDHYNDFEDNIGIVRLNDKVDYKYLQVMEVFEEQINLYEGGNGANICGWGSVEVDDQKILDIEKAVYADKLHCTSILLTCLEMCRGTIPQESFEKKILCGQALRQGRKTTTGDEGSPLTKLIKVDGDDKIYIIGITLPRYEVGGKTFFRFVRSNILIDGIKELTEKLQEDEDMEVRLICVGNPEENPANISTKRFNTD